MGVTAWTALSGETAAAVVLLLLAVAWLGADADFEGPILFRLSQHHGVVAADLVAFVAIAIAGRVLLKAAHRRAR
ncbi:MAG: hypothetical protein WKF54_03095 [Nocardioidaceae bacterium]